MTYPNDTQPQVTPPKNSTLALIGFILAIVSVVGLFIRGLSTIAFLCAPAGLVVSIIANSQIKKANGTMGGRGFAVAGIWISAVWMGLGLLLLIVGAAFIGSMLPGLLNGIPK
ncbi:MAG: hypothetical protein ACM3XM_13965 [Mycobacterium leprae]